ncbi:hypothetical protein [Amycolatopsis sp. NPDC059657]|uniref:phage shock envelope stress response protein PspM n=1 Tax=Amycolatopsis sp. NPDC059657 TaxID=3346899 RepID=UPI00367055FA
MSSGKRDFSEFNAKLEKHIERLPDYAQRAQEKLQKYFPPGEEGANRPSSPGRPAASRPPMKMPPVRLPQLKVPAEIPVVAEARAKWTQWNAPESKLQRRKRRASRAMTFWFMLTVLCGLYALVTGTGLIGNPAGDMAQAVAGIAGVIITGTLGVRSGLRLRQLGKTQLPASSTPPPLPSASSAARIPMERLAESEASLTELLRQLSIPTSVGTTAIPEISVADARNTANEAAAALRGLAGRIQAIERARNAAPAGERAALDSAIRSLTDQLDDGLEGYGALVAAAGHAVAASGGGMGVSKEALTNATDHLAGLAIALRELS